jgi:hypothetical protein
MSVRVIITTGMIIGQNIHQQDSAGFRHQLILDIKTDVFCFVFLFVFLFGASKTNNQAFYM